MKVKDLKALIAELPDTMEVVIPGNDHSYTRCTGQTGELFYDWPVYYDPEEGQLLTKVLIIE